MQHVFIVGSKGFGNYGGYETFVEKLTEYHKDCGDIKYHVACKSNDNSEFEHNSARGFNIKVPNIGPAQAIYYDVKALNHCCRYIKDNNIEKPIIYILACRIGPFAKRFYKKVHALGGQLYINPDGHEWKRAKWPAPVRKYWKISEKMMVKSADLIICDSKNIEKYILESYSEYSPKTDFIAYGSETTPSKLDDNDEKFTSWLEQKGLSKKNYYLVVGRFVPENNYETMIREFMASNSKRDFAIITTANESFLEQLENRLKFKSDKRIKFVGTVYDAELLKKIRENAYGYFHGHEVGGTNPSLLEALGSTDLNLLLDVGFNREVAESGALYWTKEEGSLAALIDRADKLADEDIAALGDAAKQRIEQHYSWQFIADRYHQTFVNKRGQYEESNNIRNI